MTKHFAPFQTQSYQQLRGALPLSFLSAHPLFTSIHQDTEIESKANNVTAEDLNTLFGNTYWKSLSNKHGVVFTPLSYRKRLVEKLSFDDKKLNNCKILDPAVGGGMLLVQVIETLIEQGSLTTVQKANTFIKQSLYGIDHNPVAIEVTKLSLLLSLLNRFPESQNEIVRGHEIWKNNFITGNTLFVRAESIFPEIMNTGGFTHIIGNPPYGLSRDDQISKDELRAIKTKYRDVIQGKPNKYMVFLARSLEFLRDRGTVSFLIPNSWLGIKSGKALRTHLLEHGYLRDIVLYQDQGFEGRGVETVIVQCEKEFQPSFTISVWRSPTESAPQIFTSHNVEEILKRDDAFIPIGWTDETTSRWRHIDKKSKRLSISEIGLTPYIALQVYATGKGTPPQTKEIVQQHAFHSDVNNNENESYRYLQGRDVSRYNLSWSGKYLNYGPWVAEFQPIKRYQGPRIILREILGKEDYLFHGAYTDETYLYNRSLLHIIPIEPYRDQLEMRCLALLALMNSRFGSFYLRSLGRKTQRGLFPKVVNDDLKSFPVPIDFIDAMSLLASKAEQLMRGSDKKIEEELEEQILHLYDIRSVESIAYTSVVAVSASASGAGAGSA